MMKSAICKQFRAKWMTLQESLRKFFPPSFGSSGDLVVLLESPDDKGLPPIPSKIESQTRMLLQKATKLQISEDYIHYLLLQNLTQMSEEIQEHQTPEKHLSSGVLDSEGNQKCSVERAKI